MIDRPYRLQALVFSLVVAAFSTVYITQPVLPVLTGEFGVSEFQASLSVSAVILGMALANLPFGLLADRFPVRPIILVGGLVITLCGLFCAATTSTTSLWLLVLARFVQGLFIPTLSTCVVVYLGRSLPLERLNVVMGSYVSATVAGGLSGRLLGGWLHPPLHWRYAFVTASILLFSATLAALRWLPPETRRLEIPEEEPGFITLLSRREVRNILLVAFGAFFVFSSIFNYLPFYLAAPPFRAPTQVITLMYLAYLLGVVIGPVAGNLSNRFGNGATMAGGAVVFALAIAATLIPSLWAVAASLAGVCLGFFAIHAAAAGLLNRRLTVSRGRANSLYILFYYLGGSVGITLSGLAHERGGWPGVALLGIMMLSIPFSIGWRERKAVSEDL
ncbi:MAG: MFS transporter [Deltaproteobacteria bacterium]|nr:MFS transporter [Deltaproteobacteria bacterium]